MRSRKAALAGALLAVALVGAGCGGTGDAGTLPASVGPSPTPTPPATASVPPTVTATPATPGATRPPRPRRVVVRQAWTPFAAVGGITLRHPAALVERVGFHQSNHEGARVLTVLRGAVAPATLEGRGRLTRARTAADVVVEPSTAIRSPVTGRVKRAGTYVLYCEHSDDFVVIAPDARPAWEVKLLHIDGVRVRRGDRVVAGVTVLAPRATQLPFESQVDEIATVKPAWPHVHIEVVDPAIPNRPSPNSGC